MLINVGPSKPARKLPEAERKALLSTNETPESTLDATPPHRLYLETSFTNANPAELLHEPDYLNRSSGAFSIVSDANSLSWDYAAPMDVGSRQQQHVEKVDAIALSKEAGFPPRPRPNFKLDLPNPTEEWPERAPLATPETLSDTSSIDSGSWKGSRKFTNGYQRLTTGMPTMEPIQQSPLRAVRAEGYHYFIPVPSPVEYHESPEREYTTLGPPDLPLAQSTPLKNQITTEATVESDVPPMKPPRSSLSLNPCTEAMAEQGSTDTSFDMTVEEDKLREKLTKSDSMNNYKLTFEDEGHRCGMDYVRHSPDEFANQLRYDPLLGHYSHGGRGYPHGGYMCNDMLNHQSSSVLPEEGPTVDQSRTEDCVEVNELDLNQNKTVELEEGTKGGNPPNLVNIETDALVASQTNGENITDLITTDSFSPKSVELQQQNGLSLVHSACAVPDLVVPGRPRLKPYSSHERARSSTPEDEFGSRLSAAPSDEVFILDAPNVEESTDT